MVKWINYYEYPEWKAFRKMVYERENYICQDCHMGEREVHAHHTYYHWGWLPWDYPLPSMRCLCKKCHDSLHTKMHELCMNFQNCRPFNRDLIEGYSVGVVTLDKILQYDFKPYRAHVKDNTEGNYRMQGFYLAFDHIIPANELRAEFQQYMQATSNKFINMSKFSEYMALELKKRGLFHGQ